MASRVKIHIEKNNQLHKVTSVYIGGDGSFKLDVPYCDFSQATAFKFPADYGIRTRMVPEDDFSQVFTTDRRPQLSIHTSGFVQISGPGINSGIDEKTKAARGLGLYTFPLHTPIMSGPTCGIQVWGLENYELSDTVVASDIVFKETDFIRKVLRNKERMDEVSKLAYNFYMLDFFVFPGEYSAEIKHDATGREVFTHQFYNYYECPGVIFTLKVIRLKNSEVFLGVLPMLFKSPIPLKFPYGFNMGSPAGTNTPSTNASQDELHHLQVMYPTIFSDTDNNIESLHYNP